MKGYQLADHDPDMDPAKYFSGALEKIYCSRNVATSVFFKHESARLLQQSLIRCRGQLHAFRSIIYPKAAHWERKEFPQTITDVLFFCFINHLWSDKWNANMAFVVQKKFNVDD